MGHEQDLFLDAGMRGFIVNKARKEFWRVNAWYDFDDLVQDGYLCYAKCRARYRNTVTDKPHFMALVQTAFHNHIMTLAGKHRLAKKESALSSLTSETRDEAAVLHSSPFASTSEMASLSLLISQAPAEFKQLIQLLVGDGAEALGFKRKAARRGKGVRETTNEYYCRLLGKCAEDED